MGNKKLIFGVIIAIMVLAVGGVGFWYWSQREAQESAQEPTGVVGSAKTISESVPEIETNPAEKVPEINPLDRANPFRYTNPLR